MKELKIFAEKKTIEKNGQVKEYLTFYYKTKEGIEVPMIVKDYNSIGIALITRDLESE